MLEVRVPKPEQRKPRKVAIAVGRQGDAADTIEGEPSNGAAPELSGSAA